MKPTAQLVAENDALRGKLADGAEARLRAFPGVFHVSVGLKEVGGKVTDELCYRVYVHDKKASADLAPEQHIPAEIDGVATDVNIVPEIMFRADHARYRPIRGGIEITNRIIDINDAGTGTQIAAGTLGCIAIDNTDDAPVILSNWHVLMANGARAGDKVFQPAPSSLPPTDLGDLPLRPTDDTDKIAIIRRSVISDKVDGAIAAIDVSSCCHCCGIHFSNELPGLSVGGHPTRSTIVGDTPAVSGMSVFKLGRSTIRTEARVVDANYPSFSITQGGSTYTFTGQVAIKQLDETQAFGDRGDSGSVVINNDSKIIGLFFATGRNAGSGGAAATYISLASHIADVFSELNIRIAYSPDVVVTAGAGLAEAPTRVFEAPVPEPYRAFRDRLAREAATALMVEAGQQHQDEIMRLVNHCRPVMVAWRRAEGPAWLVTLMGRVRDGRTDLPREIRGVGLDEALRRMRAALERHGADALRDTLRRPEADTLIDACARAASLDDIVAFVAAQGSPERVGDG